MPSPLETTQAEVIESLLAEREYNAAVLSGVTHQYEQVALPEIDRLSSDLRGKNTTIKRLKFGLGAALLLAAGLAGTVAYMAHGDSNDNNIVAPQRP